ncbi:methyltransferase domain-containing protein [Streptomyces sp. NPDC004787]|uniref:methyltransferase domain-containing protein n=1 Tax=Streptomyces sp. NPDC004787 TaxID=3154291 RepID=UPI0033A75876
MPDLVSSAFDRGRKCALCGKRNFHLIDAGERFVMERLKRLRIRPGMRCLEVSPDADKIANWLTERVGLTGAVVATDISPNRMQGMNGLKFLGGDVASALPADEFDIIHARLDFLRPANHQVILSSLMKVLRPGGWIQVEACDESSYGPVILAPSCTPRTRASYMKYTEGLQRLLGVAGVDFTWGRDLANSMRQVGLSQISAEPYVEQWRTDSPGVYAQIHNIVHFRDRLVDVGVAESELKQARQVMADPEFISSSCLVYSVQGQRPLA